MSQIEHKYVRTMCVFKGCGTISSAAQPTQLRSKLALLQGPHHAALRGAALPKSNASVLTTYLASKFEVDLSHTCVPYPRDNGTLCLHAPVSIDAGFEGGLSRCRSSPILWLGKRHNSRRAGCTVEQLTLGQGSKRDS